MSNSWSDHFPNLHSKNFQVTSPRSNMYNCVAWAMNRDDRWWWPGKYYFWPKNVSRNRTVDAFLELFMSFGYQKCNNDLLESGYEKIALYVKNKTNLPTHIARQKENGLWTSKLGDLEDIEHKSPEDLSGPAYGTVFCYFKRSRSKRSNRTE